MAKKRTWTKGVLIMDEVEHILNTVPDSVRKAINDLLDGKEMVTDGITIHAVYSPRYADCDHDGCDAPIVYHDDTRSLCDNHYTEALEIQGGACDGKDFT